MSQYRVNLDIFAGPLDLLLYLVRKDEVDIYDIEIAKIAEEYIKYIEVLKLLDIELAGDFLVMAATLMEIKSALLLPRVEQEEETEEGEGIDPRKELVRQLLEYKKFKDAANILEDSAEKRSIRYTRPDVIISNIEPTEEPELQLDEVSIWSLLEAFDNIMQATGRYQSYEHITDDTSIDMYQIEVLHRLQTEGPMTFREVFRDKNNRLQLVGLFLAMLELMKSELIWVEQKECSDEIRIRATTDVPAEIAVPDAIYKNQEEEVLQAQQKSSDADIQIDNSVNTSQEVSETAAPQTENSQQKITAEVDSEHEKADSANVSRETLSIPIVEIPPKKPNINSYENIEKKASNLDN